MSTTTRHLIDPELLCGLDAIPEFDLENTDLVRIREAASDLLPVLESYASEKLAIEQFLAPASDGHPDVPVIVYKPTDAEAPLPLLLNLHGGGYVLGAAEDNASGDARTAAEVGCAVASVEYRLAPEEHAPAQVEDCYVALRWLFRNAEQLGLDPTRFAVGGQSAGGGLAAALAILARDRGEVPLCFQSLIYPMLDDRTAADGHDSNPNCGEYIWTRESNYFGWKSLLGREPGSEGISCYAAPARADDLSGLPPAYICVGALDLFLEEDIDFAKRLMRAGVPVELHVIPGAYHGFELAPEARVTVVSERERRNALSKAFEY